MILNMYNILWEKLETLDSINFSAYYMCIGNIHTVHKTDWACADGSDLSTDLLLLSLKHVCNVILPD